MVLTLRNLFFAFKLHLKGGNTFEMEMDQYQFIKSPIPIANVVRLNLVQGFSFEPCQHNIHTGNTETVEKIIQ